MRWSTNVNSKFVQSCPVHLDFKTLTSFCTKPESQPFTSRPFFGSVALNCTIQLLHYTKEGRQGS